MVFKKEAHHLLIMIIHQHIMIIILNLSKFLAVKPLISIYQFLVNLIYHIAKGSFFYFRGCNNSLLVIGSLFSLYLCCQWIILWYHAAFFQLFKTLILNSRYRVIFCLKLLHFIFVKLLIFLFDLYCQQINNTLIHIFTFYCILLFELL